jgi:hypothetical protein
VAELGEPHDHHDPVLVAALLDGDLAPTERAEAEAWVATCTACAALHSDLLALSVATRALPAPARGRDFTLTAADAARLNATAPGEPSAVTARLTGVMTDTHAAAHASHDTILVASLADHSLATAEREGAEALVAACGLCAALHADLLALRAAARAMPTPARPRDYMLTPQDAARLRPGGWRRFVAAIGSSRDAFSRPLAVGLTTLGLAGLLVASIPSIMQGSAASLPTTGSSAERTTVGAPVPAANPAVNNDSSLPSAAPAAPSDGKGVYAALASPAAAPVASGGFAAPIPDSASPGTGLVGIAGGGQTPGSSGVSGVSNAAPGATSGLTVTGDQSTPASTSTSTGVPTLVLVSGALLLAGLATFAIRWGSRRLRDD